MIDLNKEEEKLAMQGEMLNEIESWWSLKIGIKVSEFNYLQECLLNKWDEDKFKRAEELQADISFLLKKKNFELKEQEKHQLKVNDFQKIKDKYKLNQFKMKLKNLNSPSKST